MKKFGKKAAALACALLMLTGSAVQVSAGSTGFVFHKVSVTGTAAKVSTTKASATTSFTNKPAGASGVSVFVRAYILVNGTRKYGTLEFTSTSTSSGSVTGTKTDANGFGQTGYGGEHSVTVMFLNADGSFTNYSSGNHYSNY